MIEINFPDKVEFNGVTSIWSDGIMLAIGCDNQVVMVYLPNMDVEYWTELGTDETVEILKKKHRMCRKKFGGI